MSNATKSMSKSDMEKAKVAESAADTSSDDIDSLKAKIKSTIQKLSPVEKSEMQAKLKSANLPTAYNKVSDPDVLTSILNIVAS